MNTSFKTRLAVVCIVALTWVCRAVDLDHSARLIGNTITYNLVDLDNFSVRDFGYCKWGVLQDEDNHNTVNLDFTRLTSGPYANSTKELFLSRSKTSLQPFQFPTASTWQSPPPGALLATDGSVSFTQQPGLDISPNPSLNVVLFRYLHFGNTLQTTEADGTKTDLRASEIIT